MHSASGIAELEVLPITDAPAQVVETHVSTLFFVGDRVYKLKKAVSLGFLDFGGVEARRTACQREVELNRRLAPDVYLGVADIVDWTGTPCDHLVVMRRMPQDRRLATLVATPGARVLADLRAVARAVAVFHARARRSAEIDASATVERVRANWGTNLAEMRRFVGLHLDADLVDRVARRACRYLDGRGELFARRIAQGHVCDGHGDLLASDIFCLDDGPRILDCIEFDDTLRHGDVLADVAFLAMDLERLGRPGLAAHFVESYGEFTGETHPDSLVHHYIAYRAMVRAKVACLRAEQGDGVAAAEAAQLQRIALRHAEHARVVLVLVGGLPGTGKSTISAEVADATGAVVLRSDEVRKDLAGIPHSQRAAASFRGGIYSDDMTERVYRELAHRAERLLMLGTSVVIDATWGDRRWRRLARAVARSTSSDLVELQCQTPTALAARRIRAREDTADETSDATAEIAAQMAGETDAWPTAETVATDSSRETSLCAALRAIGRSARDGDGERSGSAARCSAR